MINGGNIHAKGGKGVKNSNIPDADAIMADQIILNPHEGYRIEVKTKWYDEDITLYSKKTTVQLEEKPEIYLNSITKAASGNGGDGNTPTETTKSSKPTDASLAATGDSSCMGFWIAMFFVSVMVLVLCKRKAR